MIQSVFPVDIKQHVQNVRQNKQEFTNNLANIEGKINDLKKKIDSFVIPDPDKFVKCEDINTFINEIKESFEYLVQTPREITDLRNELKELKTRLELLEVDKEIQPTEFKRQIPKLLIKKK